MSDFLHIVVSDHTEKKNGLTYLPWSWAWTEVLKIDADATWEVVEYSTEERTVMPVMYLRDGTAMVKVNVTILGKTKCCVLPIMNHKNQAIENPNAFQINTGIMRCLAKAIAMFGLGLYIYSGEDLPEEVEKKVIIPASPKTEDLGLSLEIIAELEEMAVMIKEYATTNAVEALKFINEAALEGEERIALNNMLDSKTRTALKKAKETL